MIKLSVSITLWNLAAATIIKNVVNDYCLILLSVNTCMHIYIHICIHTYIYSHVRTHAHVCMCVKVIHKLSKDILTLPSCRHLLFLFPMSDTFLLRSCDKCVLQPYTDTCAISFWHITIKCSMPYVVWLGINAKFTLTTLPVTTHYQSFKYTLNVRCWTIKSSFMQNWCHYFLLTRSLFHPHRIYNINIP